MHFPSVRLAARLWEKLLWGRADIWELSTMPDLHTSLSYTNPRRVRAKGKKVRRKTSPTKLSLQHRPAEELRLSRPSRDFTRSVNNSIATGRSFVSHMQASIIWVLSRLCHTPRKIWRWQWKERRNGSPFKGQVQEAYRMSEGSGRTTSGQSGRGFSDLWESPETNIPIFISGSKCPLKG